MKTDSGAVAALDTRVTEVASQQTAAQATLAQDLATLSDRVAALESAPVPAAPDLSRIDALDQRLAAIEALPSDGIASTAALSAKLAQLEQRLAALPATGSDPALQQKLDDALARLSEAEAAADARASEAEAAAQAADRAKALDALAAAVDAGQPFAAELQALADPTLSDALGAAAETGVPTLAALQSAFPDAARATLRLARDVDTADGLGTRMLDFLAAQTGARPLTPLEGDSVEAILSRADFALSEGRVADAVAELETLDPAVRTPIDPWIAQGKLHLAAVAALQSARGK